MRRDIGHHHPFPPEPIIDADTRYVDAGAVRIGVESRRIDGLADRLRATYTGTPFEAVFEEWRQNRAAAPDRPPTETAGMAALGGGVSLHVIGVDDGHEYLRFDCLDGVPHYHYLRPWTQPEDCDNHAVDWDEVAHGPMLPWALSTLRTRVPEMLIEAGGAEVAARLDPVALRAAVDRVEALVEETHPSRAG
ncbi:MAG TPA: hypothetical protein VLX59_08770 [Acidimicrobiales bacterium]|nr:hypothetical protein [Acidimicrobiales bacterium]